ncbi:MAG: hypothetical protein RI949_3017 [Pseudomonadota bacterium]|jgi:perosamine synthetase
MIPITVPLMGEAEAEAARRVILSGWTTQGPEVEAFEAEFAQAVGAPHACAVSNCTNALHLALMVAGVQAGDEVITASHSFVATANSIRYVGATPVFVDIDPRTFNLDPHQVEQALTVRTRAILCVHQMGLPCDLSALVPIAQRHGLALVEDAACALGSEVMWNGQWERIGRPHGDVACFSFHPRKVISTGDGGMLTTRHPAWDKQFRELRQHAMSVPDTVRHGAREVIFESYPKVGFNYRMTDIQAAVGREQLKRLNGILQRRREIAQRYRKLLPPALQLGLPQEPAGYRSNWQSYCMRLPDEVDQRAFMQGLLDHGVGSRRGIMCSHRESAHTGARRFGDLSRSEQAQDHCVLLPVYPGLSRADQWEVVQAVDRVAAGLGVDTTSFMSSLAQEQLA